MTSSSRDSRIGNDDDDDDNEEDAADGDDAPDGEGFDARIEDRKSL